MSQEVSEEAKNSENIEFNYDNSQVVYSDVVEINIENDAVCLGFAVKDKNGEAAKVSHRIYMTLTNFFEFSEACNLSFLNFRTIIQNKANPSGSVNIEGAPRTEEGK